VSTGPQTGHVAQWLSGVRPPHLGGCDLHRQ